METLSECTVACAAGAAGVCAPAAIAANARARNAHPKWAFCTSFTLATPPEGYAQQLPECEEELGRSFRQHPSSARFRIPQGVCADDSRGGNGFPGPQRAEGYRHAGAPVGATAAGCAS